MRSMLVDPWRWTHMNAKPVNTRTPTETGRRAVVQPAHEKGFAASQKI